MRPPRAPPPALAVFLCFGNAFFFLIDCFILFWEAHPFLNPRLWECPLSLVLKMWVVHPLSEAPAQFPKPLKQDVSLFPDPPKLRGHFLFRAFNLSKHSLSNLEVCRINDSQTWSPVTKFWGTSVSTNPRKNPFSRPQIWQNAFQNFLNLGDTSFLQPCKSGVHLVS